ncbi:recombinase family protein [Bradyrhizobium japonicum]|uniref:recombinase family protein n=1 Tax=Bradyrhizobium japonicum TaxID=375 RepID=UPI001E2EA1CC|nr:recombinase family protein [Bradyrhizobium japonicum]MCD9825249.1 recombinase family protein [Bradyrhizobium japonicum]MCD9898267.1 recombinase family protein [Bradyrhizobium japonicum]WLB28528.1 recombinase family protein [Bradyrhizobium japonicum]
MNKKGVPQGPRGGAWNAWTIDSSRKRLNGILQNELSAGRIIWNRQKVHQRPGDRQAHQPRKPARAVDDC